MKICVFGLWHLGSVSAACLAEHFPVTACDPDAPTIERLQDGQPPVLEPGLPELVRAGRSAGRLNFTTDVAAAVAGADLVWIAFDTPVDDRDVPDVEFVARQVPRIFPHLAVHATVLISSQVPVGFTARMAAAGRQARPDHRGLFAYSPENLRLGRALDAFRHPERVVIGARAGADDSPLRELFRPFSERIEWMSVESAEMTKHALNGFLAVSVAYINEIATLCEKVDADAKQVERGLKSDPRIGKRAYLSPGGAFAGGTLARDVRILQDLGRRANLPVHLLDGVTRSNDEHRAWAQHKLVELLGTFTGRTVAILGLAYKPNTDTLRRSGAVELGRWLKQEGAAVRAYDPAIPRLPAELAGSIQLCASAREALQGADAAVVATEWPVFRELAVDEAIRLMRAPRFVDANRFLEAQLAADPRVCYAAVGRKAETP